MKLSIVRSMTIAWWKFAGQWSFAASRKIDSGGVPIEMPPSSMRKKSRPSLSPRTAGPTGRRSGRAP